MYILWLKSHRVTMEEAGENGSINNYMLMDGCCNIMIMIVDDTIQINTVLDIFKV